MASDNPIETLNLLLSRIEEEVAPLGLTLKENHISLASFSRVYSGDNILLVFEVLPLALKTAEERAIDDEFESMMRGVDITPKDTKREKQLEDLQGKVSKFLELGE